jgi:hypothetical protein
MRLTPESSVEPGAGAQAKRRAIGDQERAPQRSARRGRPANPGIDSRIDGRSETSVGATVLSSEDG